MDNDGNPTAIRVVRDHVDHVCTLEDTATMNAGEEVEFVAMAFDLESPPVNASPSPEIIITVEMVQQRLWRIWIRLWKRKI